MTYSIEHDPEQSGRMMIVQSVVLILGFLCVSLNANSDIFFAGTYVVFYLISFYCIWNGNGKRVSPYILFFLTMGLFLGGKFWAFIFDPDMNLFFLDWFTELNLDLEQKQRLMYYFLALMGLLNIGYLYQYSYNFEENNEPHENELFQDRLRIILRNALFVIGPLVLYAGYKTLLAVSAKGYTLLYEVQDEEYSSASGLANILLMIGIGITYGYNITSLKKYYLGVYIVSCFFTIMMGARGAFGVLLLFLLWIFSMSHKVSGKKLILYLSCAVLLLIFVFSFSVRAMENNLMRLGYDSTTDVLIDFIAGQGISLMVFDASQLVDHYPALAYVQSIIPGTSFFWHLFSGEVIDATDNNFANFLCHDLNPAMYRLGFGLGWSIMADFYLFGFKTFIGYSILSLLFGWFIGFLEIRAKSSLVIRSILFTVTPALLTLPRASMNSFFPLMFYCIVVIVILRFFLATDD